MTMVRTIKLYKVPDLPLTPGLRAMTSKDVPAVVPLLNNYLAGFKLAQVFDEEEAAHWCVQARICVAVRRSDFFLALFDKL